MVTREDPDGPARPPSNRAGEPPWYGIARIRVDLVRAEASDERPERARLELVETAPRDVLIDLSGRQDDCVAFSDGRELEVDALPRPRSERLRIPGARSDEPSDVAPLDEESPHDERTDDAPASCLIQAEDPLHGFPPRSTAHQLINSHVAGTSMALAGLVVPVPTLFSEDGSLDLARNAKFARGLADARVDHVFVLGSLGEFPSVTDEERARLLDVVVGSVSGATDVWVGCGAPSTRQAVALAEAAESAGAAALVAVPPFYLHPPLPAVERYYHSLHSAVDLPLLAYNIPSLVGYALPPAVVHRLAREEILAGMKDTSGTFSSVEAFLHGAPGGLAIFPGDDAFASSAIAKGAHGAVMGIANVVPRLCVELVAAARAGDAQGAAERQALVDALVEVGRVAPFPANMKFLARELRGAEVGYRAPYDPLTPEEMALVRSRLDRIRDRLSPFLPR